MNKTDFIKELSKQTGYDEEKCTEINSILEDTFLIGKKNKEKMIEKFMQKLNIDENESNKIYEISMQIIGQQIANKLKHPFN